MPAEPISWTVLAAVATRLQAIRQADGYHTDAGLDVVLEHAEIRDQWEAPQLLVIADGALRLADSSSRKWRDWILPVVVQARYPLSLETAQHDAHALLEDIGRALPPDMTQLGDDEFKAEVNELLIVQRPAGADFVVVQASMDVTYRINTTQ